jgi:hypothetical protein
MHPNHQIIHHLQDALNLIPDLLDSSIPHVPSAIEAEEAEETLLRDIKDSTTTTLASHVALLTSRTPISIPAGTMTCTTKLYITCKTR